MMRRQRYGGKGRNEMGFSLDLPNDSIKFADPFSSIMSGGTVMNSMMI